MRETTEGALPDTCTIRRKSVVNVGGEEQATWGDLATGVSCGIAPAGGGEIGGRTTGEVGGKIAEETTHILTLPANQDIEEPDQVVTGGITYDVTLVRKRGSWEITRRVEIKEAV